MFQTSNRGLIFLVACRHPEAIQEPTNGHFTRAKDTPITLEIPRDLGVLCTRNQGPRQNIRTKDAPSNPVAQENTRVLGAMCQELGTETKYMFLTMSQWFSRYYIKFTAKAIYQRRTSPSPPPISTKRGFPRHALSLSLILYSLLSYREGVLSGWQARDK